MKIISMKNLNFKYYPTRVILGIICILITIIFIVKRSLQKTPNLFSDALIIVGSSAIVYFTLFFLNKYFMWKYWLKLLEIPDLRGKYEGELISSYHIDDDLKKPNVTKWMKIEISQNLNGFYVTGEIFDNEYSSLKSSSFKSISHEIESNEDGTFEILYRYINIPNTFHADHEKYSLNNHYGCSNLNFNPTDNTLIGSYFNNGEERLSYGQLTLKKI